MHYEELLDNVIAIVREAGTAILDVYGRDFDVRSKSDASPVTDADERAESLILRALAKLTPDVPAVSEEAAAKGQVPDVSHRFWLVDPLDGTKEFLSRNGEFTVNVGLIENGIAVLGVVFAPALDRLFAGAIHLTAFTQQAGEQRPIACRPAPPEGITVVSSRSHADADALRSFLAGHRVASTATAGSSLKFCLIAAGEADLYPRLGRTMEWDTAAGHAVVAAAGGRVTQLNGENLIYGKSGFVNPHFMAAGL
jgi:3'(2'), 5'-bisphosphate nucleotidase